MPDMTFHCPYALNYTEGRDSAGHHLGLVEPGDIRGLDAAPDQWWHETTDEDRARLAAAQADQAADQADAELAADEGETADGGGAGSGPVPPSTLPQPVPGA